MGTKNNPGAFDCYAKAEPDEPMFILLARDSLAPGLVAIWSALRAQEYAAARRLLEEAIAIAADKQPEDQTKVAEALSCASAMARWHIQRGRGPAWAHRLIDSQLERLGTRRLVSVGPESDA